MVRLIALLCLLAAQALAQEPLPAERARLQVILDPLDAAPVEGQMLLATVRGDYRVRIALEDLPIPRSPSFDWVQLARDEWSQEQVDGLPTQVMRRRIAIFPRRAGDLTFPALSHKLTVFTASGGRAEHMVVSDPVPVSVRPALGQPWLPVTEIEFSDDWSKDPGALPLGESVRRRVVIRALGASAQMLPPQPAIRAPWLISFVSPEERTTELTPLGPLTTVVWEWSLRPKTGERGVIPDLRIPYFDTGTQSPGTIVLKATPIGYAAAPEDGAVPAWRSRFSGIGYPFAGFALGLVAPLLAFGSGARLRSRAELMRVLSRLGPDPDRRRLASAARCGDGAAFRLAATRLAAGLPPDRLPKLEALLAPLDRHLFGREPSPAPPLRPLARRILALGR